MITRDECDYIYDQAPIRIRDIDNATVGIAAGSYPGFLQVKNAFNLEIVPVDGPVEFPDDEQHIFRNCSGISFNGNNAPGLTHGLQFRGGFLAYDNELGEQTQDISFEWVHIAPRSSWAAAIYALPLKEVNAYISGFTIRKSLIDGGGNAIYLGGPEWVSEDDNEGLIHNVLVEYNHIYNTGDAIQFKSVSHSIPGLEPGYAIMRYNYIENTRLERNSAQSSLGVFAGPHGAEIYGNVIVGSEGDGIHVSSMVQGDCEVWDNTVMMSGTGDHPWFKSGIQVRNDRSVVRNNTILMSQLYGIEVARLSRNCEVYDNTVLFSGSDIPIKQGGSPEENFYRNHTEFGTADYFNILQACDIEEPEPPPEPRIWSLGMRLTMVDDELMAGDVVVSEE